MDQNQPRPVHTISSEETSTEETGQKVGRSDRWRRLRPAAVGAALVLGIVAVAAATNRGSEPTRDSAPRVLVVDAVEARLESGYDSEDRFVGRVEPARTSDLGAGVLVCNVIL